MPWCGPCRTMAPPFDAAAAAAGAAHAPGQAGHAGAAGTGGALGHPQHADVGLAAAGPRTGAAQRRDRRRRPRALGAGACRQSSVCSPGAPPAAICRG
ncbi:hypothetical protein ACFQGW_07865 [Xanthomonas theicola]|uniref:hypothetical protein n=1 Tax=Xanthomonas theicola TaxID=56464 RepID=UPI0036117FF5